MKIDYEELYQDIYGKSNGLTKKQFDLLHKIFLEHKELKEEVE